MEPAYSEFVRRGIMLPGWIASALWHVTLGRKSSLTALEQLSPGLPTGVFNKAVGHPWARLFAAKAVILMIFAS